MLIAAYRIVKTRWAALAFDGEGARRTGGRWNSVGTPVVYTAESRSLAALEVLVHLEGPARGFSIVRCEFDDSAVEVLEASSPPPDWWSSPAPLALAHLGDAWVARASSGVLSVPSAVVAGERNYLINPAHPGFARINIGAAEPFPYDPRVVRLTERR